MCIPSANSSPLHLQLLCACLHGGRGKTEQRVISISMVPQAAFSRWCRSLHNGLSNAATVLCLLHWKVGFMDARATNFEMMRCIKRKWPKIPLIQQQIHTKIMASESSNSAKEEFFVHFDWCNGCSTATAAGSRAHCLKITQKCRIWIFGILAFATNFCPFKSGLSGNTVWPQALAKTDNFWHF